MIYTITFSPSIDYYISNDENFNPKGLNRINNFSILPGGKGLNASVVLKRHGYDNKAITFLGGETGNLIKTFLEKEKINIINIAIKNNSRINVKYFDKKNNFEINGPKTKIETDHINKLKNKLSKINSKDIVFIMGISNEDQIFDLVKFIYSKKAKIIIDIDSKIILDLLKYKPFVIKPNIHELENLFNVKIKTKNEIKEYMTKLQLMGATNIIVSMGEKGSYVLSEKEFIYIKGFKADKVLSTIGAGDTMISLFAMKLLDGKI